MTTAPASFEEDLAAYREAGAEAIALAEFKLPEGQDDRSVGMVRESGLTVTACLPGVPSVLPLPKFPGPDDPAERVEALCAGIRRLAAFGPTAVYGLTGPQGSLDAAEARAVAVDGLRRAARMAAEVGLTFGIEALHPSIRDDWTLVTTIAETLELIEEVGEPNVAFVYDVWHVWDAPNVLEDTRRYADRFVAVHVNDWRDPTRNWNDRVLPGDGIANVPSLLGALEAGGYDGWYDLEIFSDDGSFSDQDFEDSLWKQDPVDVVRRGKAGFLRAWEARKVPA